MSNKLKCYMKTPIGTIVIEEDGEAITALYINQDTENGKEIDCGMNCKSELLRKAGKQLQEYFMGRRKEFDLPIRLHGTAFQQKVWSVLRQIPYGETRSYGEVAAAIGNPKASRAVGGANNKNPIMLIVPCHCVIGADGSLTGFGGGLRAKEYLLSLEKKHNL